MALVPDISQLGGALDAFQALLLRAQTEVVDEEVRQKLTVLAAKMTEAQRGLLTSYPKAMAGMEQELAGAKGKAQATLDQVKQMRQQAEEMEKARNAPPAAPPKEEPLDPALGQKLRVELLERFGDGVPDKKERGKKTMSRSEFHEMLRKSGVIK